MNQKNIGPDGAYRTRLLTPADLKALQALFERCTDYFTIATGGPPQPDEATRAFVAGPPTKSVDDKRVVGVFSDTDMVGVIDALVDWPEPGVWSVGMMLLDPKHRRNGLGSALHQAFESWSGTHGAQSYRTAIVTQHVDGVRFLERCGYKPDKTLDGYNAGSQISAIRFYTKDA